MLETYLSSSIPFNILFWKQSFRSASFVNPIEACDSKVRSTFYARDKMFRH